MITIFRIKWTPGLATYQSEDNFPSAYETLLSDLSDCRTHSSVSVRLLVVVGAVWRKSCGRGTGNVRSGYSLLHFRYHRNYALSALGNEHLANN